MCSSLKTVKLFTKKNVLFQNTLAVAKKMFYPWNNLFIMSAKELSCWVKKNKKIWQFLMKFSTYCIHEKIMGVWVMQNMLVGPNHFLMKVQVSDFSRLAAS